MNERINILLLVFLLLWIPFLGYFGYYLSVGSDQYEVIRFAQDLARGTIFRDHPVFNLVKDRTEPGRLYAVHYGGYLLKDGKMYCKYAIGYSLILALSLTVFGFTSVFFVNFFVLSALLLVVFLIGRIHFRERHSPAALAVGASLLLFLLCGEFWDLSVTPHGDVSSVLFAAAAVYFLLRALTARSQSGPTNALTARSQSGPTNGPLPPGGGARALWLLAAGFCLGFSASIRPPNILLGFPIAFYFLSRTVGKVRLGRIIVLALLMALAVLAGLLPVFTQNYLTSGNILKFTQFHEIHLETLNAAVATAKNHASAPVSLGRRIIDIFVQRTSGWGIGNIHAALPVMSFHLLLAFGPLFSLLFLGGLAAGWRKMETRYLFLPAILTFLIFYSGWVRPLERYLIIVYPFIALVVLDGVSRFLSSPRPFAARFRLPLALLAAVLIAGDFVFRSLNFCWGIPPYWEIKIIFAAILIPALTLLVLSLRPRRSAGEVFNLALAAAILLSSLPVFAAQSHLFQFPQSRRFREDVGKLLKPPSILFATKFLTQTVDLFTDSVSIRPFDLDFAVPDLGEAYDLLLRESFHLYLIDNRGKRNAAAYLPPISDYFSAAPIGTLAGKDYNLKDRFGKPVCTVYSIERWKDETIEFALATLAPADYLLTLNLHKIWDTLPSRSSVSAFLNGVPWPHRFENGVNYFLLSAESLSFPRSTFEIRSDQGLPPDSLVDLRWAFLDYVMDFGEDAEIPDRTFLFRPAREEDEEYGSRTVGGEARIAIPPTRGEGRRSAEFSVRKIGDKNAQWTAALDGVSLGPLPLEPTLRRQTAEIMLPPSSGPSTRSILELSGASSLSIEHVRIKRWGESFQIPTPEAVPYLLQTGVSLPGNAPETRFALNGRDLGEPLASGEAWAILPPDLLRRPLSALALSPAGSGAVFHVALFRRVEYPFRIEAGSPGSREFKDGGFYSPERYLSQTPFAWTEGEAQLRLPFAADGMEGMKIKIGYIGGRPPGVPVARVSLELDKKPLGGFVPEPGMKEAILLIPPELIRRGVSLLTIKTNVWRPADYPPAGDTRELGLMVRYVELGK